MERRLEAEAVLSSAAVTVEIYTGTASRAPELALAGYAPYDALHLAAAESAGADVLLIRILPALLAARLIRRSSVDINANWASMALPCSSGCAAPAAETTHSIEIPGKRI